MSSRTKSGGEVVGLHGPTVDKLAGDMGDNAAAAVVVYYDHEGRALTGWSSMKVAELAHLFMVLESDIRRTVDGERDE